jgi:hypothetical protein
MRKDKKSFLARPLARRFRPRRVGPKWRCGNGLRRRAAAAKKIFSGD